MGSFQGALEWPRCTVGEELRASQLHRAVGCRGLAFGPEPGLHVPNSLLDTARLHAECDCDGRCQWQRGCWKGCEVRQTAVVLLVVGQTGVVEREQLTLLRVVRLVQQAERVVVLADPVLMLTVGVLTLLVLIALAVQQRQQHLGGRGEQRC